MQGRAGVGESPFLVAIDTQYIVNYHHHTSILWLKIVTSVISNYHIVSMA